MYSLVRLFYFFYFSIELIVELALYGPVWYGPLMVVVFTFLSIYICFVHRLEWKYELWSVVLMITQCELQCLVSSSSIMFYVY